MLGWLHQLLGGSSPVTGYIGSAIMILDVAQQVLLQQGLPKTAAEWLAFVSALITGLGLRFSQDVKKVEPA